MRQRVMSYSGLLLLVPNVYIASLLVCNYTSLCRCLLWHQSLMSRYGCFPHPQLLSLCQIFQSNPCDNMCYLQILCFMFKGPYDFLCKCFPTFTFATADL